MNETNTDLIISGPGGIKEKVTKEQLNEESVAAVTKAQLRNEAKKLNKRIPPGTLLDKKATELNKLIPVLSKTT
jgi:hypothetical protein